MGELLDNDLLLEQAKTGFGTLKVSQEFRDQAIKNIKLWLTNDLYVEDRPQLVHMIGKGYWDYLLDCFYQVIPFGTGGRRGEVGIGPNRINKWAIKTSAQGHTQYLIKQFGKEAKVRGVVLTYDVREFFTNKYFNDDLPNPVRNLKCVDLARAAAEVYAANGVKSYMFEDVRTTPELSFAIRHLKAVGGDMFSASHNPPEHNGKKIYDQFGGQLVPPEDEDLVREVTENVSEVKQMDFNEAVQKGLVEMVEEKVDEAYIAAAAAVSLSNKRDIKIVYTPLHGCGMGSVLKVLEHLGFEVDVDPKTSNPSGKFENVTFNIPNPEVEQSFDTPLVYAKEKQAEILLNSDPDADRIGVSVLHKGEWVYMNGNEIAGILAEYVTQKRKDEVGSKGVMIKTLVTTNIIREICRANGFRLEGDLLVGFKYIGQEMNKLDKEGEIQNFLFGCEESHGYIAGNYLRDKDAAVAAVWLAELAAELKLEGKTLVDYLQETYAKYGFFRNYLTEIRLPGAEGRALIDKLQDTLRRDAVSRFGDFEVEKIEDMLERKPIVSETDRVSKNLLMFHLKPVTGTISMMVTIRPSGTEPKSKMYLEIGSEPFAVERFEEIKTRIEEIKDEVEKAVLKQLYKIIDIDFPDRGFLLFWQLPVNDKMKYFEIEPQIEALKNLPVSDRKSRLDEMLTFLGKNPIEKVDKAFKAKNGTGVLKYLEIS